MIQLEQLRALANALPAGTALPVPREWVLELLDRIDGQEPASTPAPADLTVSDLAGRFNRSPSTVRWWIECGRFAGAYRLRGREWRVPPAALQAFEEAERAAAPQAPTPPNPTPRRPRGRVVDLGAWRKVG